MSPRGFRWALPLAGLAATLWFAVRVLPRPSRAAYPCQRANAPLVGGFLLWLMSLGPIGLVPGPSPRPRRRWWLIAAVIPLLALTAFVVLGEFDAWRYQDGEDSVPPLEAPYSPALAPNRPVGQGVGVNPGRVVWVHDPEATTWEGEGASPWDQVDPDAIDAMVASGVRQLAGMADSEDAWAALFAQVDRRRGRAQPGFRPGDTVAIKVNVNCDGEPRGDTSPMAVRALLGQLVDGVGVPAESITVYDASRQISRDWIRRVTDGHTRFGGVNYGVRFVLPGPRHGRRVIEPDPASRVHLSALPDGIAADDPPIQLPEPVTSASYLINASTMKPHSLAGVSLCAKNLFGSIHREGGDNGGWSPSFLHAAVGVEPRDAAGGQRRGRYSPLVDLIGHPDLGGKTVLYLLDGLYAPRTSEDGPPARWSSTPFDGHWCSSLLLSQDPVAIDSVAIDLLHAEATVQPIPWLWGDLDNYLMEAAQADSPPSGTVYDPDGDGVPLASLGVHEHWSGPADRRYSRNLGRDEGIELVGIGPGTQPGASEIRTVGAPASGSTVSRPPPREQDAPSQPTSGAAP